jgi:membrane protein
VVRSRQEDGHKPTPLSVLRAQWRDVAVAVWKEVSRDNLSLVAAGVGFYAMLAIFPAIAAIVALYGLVADPAIIQEHLSFISAFLPSDAFKILSDQVTELSAQEPAKLGFGFIGALAVSMWSASRAIIAMVAAMNIAYEEEEKRNFLKLNLTALAFTVAAVFVMLLSILLIGALPALVESFGIPEPISTALLLLRWPPLAIFLLAGIALVYRFAPSRRKAKIQWITPGAVLAVGFWLIASAGFSLYASHFGKYNETFGSLGGGIVLLMWFYLSAFAVCVGAELNAELEYRVEQDTTVGRPKPKGQRGAYVADHKSADAQV